MATPAILDFRIAADVGNVAEVFALFSEELDRVIVEQVLLMLGRKIEARAKELCAVDTGMLRESIHLEGIGTLTIRIIAIGGAKGRAYALFVEYGTEKTRAQPFLKPAIFEVAPEQLPEAIGQAIKQVADAVRGVRGANERMAQSGFFGASEGSAFGEGDSVDIL